MYFEYLNPGIDIAAWRRPNAQMGRWLYFCVAIAGCCLNMSAIGQQTATPAAPNSSGELDEIVVTAAKRAESIQDVPMSITAITAQTIEREGIVDFIDYADKIPNLTFASGHGIVNSINIAIRGIQGSDTTGFYIDDMPVPTTLDPRVIDLERIEVLRGPQGTLYGAGSMGGTIRLITQPPDPDAFSAKLHSSGSQVEGGGAGYQLDASVNIPLWADRAAMRLTAFGGNDGSFINRSFPDPGNPADLDTVKTARKDFAGGMASILWKVTDDLTVRPMVLTQYFKMNGFPLSDYSAGTLEQIRPFDIPEEAQDKWTYGGVAVEYATPIGDLTSATSWLSRQNYENEDYSQQLSVILGTPLVPATFPTWQPSHSFVEELRFSSKFSGPLQMIAGVFLQRTTTNYNQYSNVPGLNASAGGAFGTDLVFEEWSPSTVKESAVFSELTYRLTSQWSATVGLRYSTIDNSFQETLGGIAAGGLTGGQGTESEHRTNPKLVIKYEPNPDLMYYALASSGFRPGNAQVPPPPTFCGSDYASSGVTPQEIAQYKSDSLWNYEVGTKDRLFDRRMTLSAAAFWINWSNLQQTVLFSCGYPYIANAGAARSRGAELELEISPTEGLTISSGIGYTDARITEASALAEVRVGELVQQVAPWTVSSSADYSFPLTARWRGIGHVDNSYVDHSFSANNNPVTPLLRPSYDIANLRLGAGTDALEIVGFISNLSNTHANLGDNQSQAAELPGRPRILVNVPRTYGVSVTMRW